MSVIYDSQRMLIDNLQQAFSQVAAPEEEGDTTQFRTGLKSIYDHLLLMKNYVCECGNTMKITDHQTLNCYDGIHSEDVYSMKCICGVDEKINFRMMTKYLRDDSSKLTRDSIRSLGYL